MSTIEEIENAVRKLSEEERATFRSWFAAFEANEVAGRECGYASVKVDTVGLGRLLAAVLCFLGIMTMVIAFGEIYDQRNMPSFFGGAHGMRELALVMALALVGSISIAFGLAAFRQPCKNIGGRGNAIS
jgi:hypothetical protein